MILGGFSVLRHKARGFAKSPGSLGDYNKIIKRYLRKKLPETIEALILCLEEIINDYNTVRPHGSLLGLTPMECYTSENVNLDFKEQKLEAKKERITQNRAVNCGVCNN